MSSIIKLGRSELRKIAASKQYIFIFAVVLLGALVHPMSGFAVMWLCFFLSAVVFQWDARFKGECLICSLPVSRSDVARGKLLVLYGGFLGFLLLSAALSPLANMIPIDGQLPLLSKLSLLLLMGGLYLAFSVPVTISLPQTKATWVNLILYMGGFVGYSMLRSNSLLSDAPSAPFVLTEGTLFFGSIALVLVLCAISTHISLRLYQKKEFLD